MICPIMKRKTSHIWLLALFALLSFSSCHTTRKVTTGVTGSNLEKARFETTVNKVFEYEALQSKVKFAMGKQNLNGKMSLESGKRFALSINAPLLGFEIGRIEATPEEILFVDKFDKLYCSQALSDLFDLKELSGHEMAAVECLMLGRIFIPGVGQARVKDFDRLVWSTESTAEGSNGLSTGVYEGKGFQLIYQINEFGQLMTTSLVMDDGRSASWNYANYQEVQKQKPVAAEEKIQISYEKGKKLNASISLTNPSLGESTWKPFQPNDSYRKVSFSELIDILRKLM